MTIEEYTAAFKANIRRLMGDSRYGTNDLAALMGIHASSLSRTLHSNKPPAASTIVAVCTAFQIEVAELFKKPTGPSRKWNSIS